MLLILCQPISTQIGRLGAWRERVRGLESFFDQQAQLAKSGQPFALFPGADAVKWGSPDGSTFHTDGSDDGFNVSEDFNVRARVPIKVRYSLEERALMTAHVKENPKPDWEAFAKQVSTVYP